MSGPVKATWVVKIRQGITDEKVTKMALMQKMLSVHMLSIDFMCHLSSVRSFS